MASVGQVSANDFKALYGYAIPSFWQSTLGVVIVVASIVTIVALLYLVWWRFWGQPQPMTLSLWAKRELAALKAELAKDEDKVNYKRFFGAVTFFIKQYLFRLYQWQILDKTDEEVKAFVEDKQEVSKAMKQQFEELFSYAQMVKFADKSALHEKAEDAMRIATQVVKELKPPKDEEKKTRKPRTKKPKKGKEMSSRPVRDQDPRRGGGDS